MSDVFSLVVLALIDSTSIGTLIIPVVLVLRRRAVDAGPLAVYFATVCGFYFLLGIALVAGVDLATERLTDVWQADPVNWLKVIVGGLLALYGIFAPDPPTAEELQVRKPQSMAPAAMVMLGLGAGVAEAATMVPYLAATAIISDLGGGWPVRILVLAVYCLVMILPAVILILLAARYGNRIWGRLERIILRIERETKITVLWIAAIIGIQLVFRGLLGLGIIGD